jgi:DNA primase
LIQVRGLSSKRAKEILDIRGKIITGAIFEGEKEGTYILPYERLVDILWDMGKGNRDYWYDRKLTDRTIDRYRLGFYDGWNLIPLYIDGKFANFQCRRDIPEKRIKMWYKIPGWSPVLINHELLQLVDSIYITEGPVDALLLTQEGIPAISHTGGAGYWNNEWFALFHRIKTIYYICDNDDAGRIAGQKICKALGYDRTFLYQFKDKPEKYDTVDFFKAGGTAKEFKEMVEKDSKNCFEIGGIYVRRAGKSYKNTTESYRRN